MLHLYTVAMEAAMLAPKAEVSMLPWKEKERIPLGVRHIHSVLQDASSSVCVSAYVFLPMI